MSEPIHDHGTGDQTASQTGRPRQTGGRPPRMPGWVKIPAIVIGVLIVVFAVLMFAGIGGDHGPGRHGPGQQEGSQAPSMRGHE